MRLGPYEILGPLGSGGMGEVHRARDTRLGRDVAIKTLPEAFAGDAERLARFEREARLLASLSHPNIAAIHGLEESGGARYLVLEFVEGETLAARLARGALPVAEALEVGRQIAAGVEAAHEGGAVHRDLKPGNVMLTPSGDVKVLDFGLAKSGAADKAGSDPNLSASPTLTHAATQAGVILGTAAYMSPEQARGRLVDKRSDIWSFGCVLYECLTGRRLFEGETVSDLIARILERTPDLSALPAQTPPRVRALIERCLEKDPKRRLRDIGEARLELEAALSGRSLVSAGGTAAAPGAAGPGRGRVFALGAALLVLGAVLGFGGWSLARRGAGANSRPVRLTLLPPPGLQVQGYNLSPDGRTVVARAFDRADAAHGEAVSRLYARPLSSFDYAPIPGTEYAARFGFSPDGHWVLFSTAATRGNALPRLAKVAIDGRSPPIALCDWQDGWQAFVWMPDGQILVTANRGTQMVRVPSGGGPPGAPVPFVADSGSVGNVYLANPLPRGDGMLAVQESWGSRGFQHDLCLVDPRTGRVHVLLRGASAACWAPPDMLLFTLGDVLNAAPFDSRRGRITGDVVPLMSGLRTTSVWENAPFAYGGGNLLFMPGGLVGARRRLTVAGPASDTTDFASDRMPFERDLALAPGGRRAAVVVTNPQGTYEIWLAERGTGGLRRGVALQNADCQYPAWSPDGGRIAFWRNAHDPGDGIYVARPGTGEAPVPIVRVASAGDYFQPLSWLPDGSGVLALRVRQGRRDLILASLSMADSTRRLRELRPSGGQVSAARLSPDGRTLAFTSDESGSPQLRLARFSADGALGEPIPVPSGGVAVTGEVQWSHDSRRVYFDTGESVLAAAVTAGPPPSVSAPVSVLRYRDVSALPGFYDVLPDGRLLVIRKGEDEGEVDERSVIVNWDSELRETLAKAAKR